MLSLVLALALGMSWPVSVLACEALASPREAREAGPTLPLVWFCALLYLLMAALNDARNAADVLAIATGTFPMEHNFSQPQSVRVACAALAGAMTTALLRGDLARMLGASRLPINLFGTTPEREREAAWLDCAYLLYADTVPVPELLRAGEATGYVPMDRAPRRWALGGFSTLRMNEAALERVRDQGNPVECRAFLSALVRLGVSLGAIELSDLVYLRVIGTRLGLSRAAIAEMLDRLGAYRMWGARASRPVWEEEQTHAPDWSAFADAFRRRTAPPPPPPPEPQAASPHDILGVARNASQAEIKAAYRALARRYHPDRFAQADLDPAEAQAITERMARINAAYDSLKG